MEMGWPVIDRKPGVTPSLPAEPNPMHSCRQGPVPQAYHIIQACLGFHSCKIELRSLLRAQ